MPLTLPPWLNPFPSHPSPGLLLFGADSSGKTTLLYRWKTHTRIRTIQTIGYNVEDITLADPPLHHAVHPSTATISKRRRTLNVWDLGGCDGLRYPMHHYVKRESSALFLHDVTVDEERLMFSLEVLGDHVAQMRGAGAKGLWVVFTKVDMLKEEERAEKLRALIRVFENRLTEYMDVEPKVVSCLACSAYTGEGVWDVFEEVLSGIHHNNRSLAVADETGPSPPKPLLEDELVRTIKAAGAIEEPSERFWAAFLSGDLEVWDHRAHLRAGYLILLQTVRQTERVHKATDNFLEHLQRLQEKNPKRFRDTANRTLTMFWLYCLYAAIQEYKSKNGMLEMPGPGQFQQVLLLRPSLMDTSHWMKYYPEDITWFPGGKESWILPDTQRLPIITFPIEQRERARVIPQKRGDADQEHMIEFAFHFMKYHLTHPGTPRGKRITEALPSLQSTIYQARARGCSNMPTYSITHLYFWLQMVHAALGSLIHRESSVTTGEKPHDGSGTLSVALEDIDYASFCTVFEGHFKGSLWRRYYSEKLWNSVLARVEFVTSDKNPLPDVLRGSGARLHEMITFGAMQQVSSLTDDDTEKMVAVPYKVLDEDSVAKRAFSLFRARMLLHEVEQLPQVDQTASDRSHAHKIKFIFESLVNEVNDIDPMALSTVVNEAVRELHEIQGVGMTEASFWARMVMIAVAKRMNSDPEKNMDEDEWIEVKSKKLNSKDEFQKLVMENPELAKEELHAEYYSAEIWESREAFEMVLPSDRGILPGGIMVLQS
ncbi:hypothetical protein P152DRAFT_485617 [Eremomyces bilateralis CBS 781.70]|uniref:Uncharacterized protein n=1 Tax=Eremomyces bilateralis CBS 781.70 TaxID=1392243 RepID=A0A6G1FRF2_9PEZI|nr:uncharacterized protein P152DRAFT_485617 [Eremomyces bilateralis CBS 781.70]KAF1808261.1 hypothetical protein P152DRAFT_485617 [Eremomyces bilateralis CBS 781.70]